MNDGMAGLSNVYFRSKNESVSIEVVESTGFFLFGGDLEDVVLMLM